MPTYIHNIIHAKVSFNSYVCLFILFLRTWLLHHLIVRFPHTKVTYITLIEIDKIFHGNSECLYSCFPVHTHTAFIIQRTFILT